MTQLLEKALSEVKALSDAEQDSIAAMILDELADERKWDESFASSQEALSKLAAKAREDRRSGRTRKQTGPF